MLFLCTLTALWGSTTTTGPLLQDEKTPLLDQLRRCHFEDRTTAKLLANRIIKENLELFPVVTDILIERLQKILSPIEVASSRMFVETFMYSRPHLFSKFFPNNGESLTGLENEILLCFADHPRIFSEVFRQRQRLGFETQVFFIDQHDLYCHVAESLIEPQLERFFFADSILALLEHIVDSNKRLQVEHALSLTPAFRTFMKLAPLTIGDAVDVHTPEGSEILDQQKLACLFKTDLGIPLNSGIQAAVLRQASRKAPTGEAPAIGKSQDVIDYIISFLTGQEQGRQYMTPTEIAVMNTTRTLQERLQENYSRSADFARDHRLIQQTGGLGLATTPVAEEEVSENDSEFAPHKARRDARRTA